MLRNIIQKYFFDNTGIFILIMVNILVFVFLNILKIFDEDIFANIMAQICMLSNISYVLTHPWIIFTSAFVHLSFFHLLFNMIGIYFFGSIAYVLLRHPSAFWLLSFSSIAIANLTFLWVSNYMGKLDTWCMGCSMIVMAILGYIAYKIPKQTLTLLFFGEMQIQYIFLLGIGIEVLYLIGGREFPIHILNIVAGIWGILFAIIQSFNKKTFQNADILDERWS